jgi:two-component system, chemotaxis family, protein-glutamate methylesterase/glutaminase
MAGHDIIVVGASAGGVEALSALARGLPKDLPAAVFVVLHISPQTPSILPTILSRVGALPASHAVNEEKIEHGRIYVAPPDHHLLVERGYVRVIRGPRENRYRPAVDPLFRSAALAYGSRVVGVILTGALDDGTAGMRALKAGGGISVVQEPREALYPGMPRNVIENVPVDYRLPLAEIAPLLVRLASEEIEQEEGASTVPDDVKTEARIAEQQMDATEMLESVQKLGEVTTFTCPECHGSLWELHNGELLRFRCHVGHAFTAESLVVEQSEELETALWSALRSLEEKVMLTRRMAQRAHDRGLTKAAVSFEARTREAERHAEVLRHLLLNGREMDASAEAELVEERE